MATVRAQVPGRLTADGTVLRDEHGRAVVLRGVNAGGRSKFAPFVPFDFGADFGGALARTMDRIASWGANVVRMPFSWEAPRLELRGARSTWNADTQLLHLLAEGPSFSLTARP